MSARRPSGPGRGKAHGGGRVREVGAAQAVEAEVDRALAGGVRTGEEGEPGVGGGHQAADDPQPCPRRRGQQRHVVAVGQRGVVVGDGEPDVDASRAPGEQAGAARLPDRAEEFDVQEEQVAAAAVRVRVAGDGPQGAGGLFGRRRLPQGRERRLRPRRTPGGDGLDALPRAQSAVRRYRRPRDRQAARPSSRWVSALSPRRTARSATPRARPTPPGATSPTVKRRPSDPATQVRTPPWPESVTTGSVNRP